MARPTKMRGETPMRELVRRRAQIEDFITRNNALKRERDEARRQAKRLLEILRDIGFAEESKAREVARRALARIERKLEAALPRR